MCYRFIVIHRDGARNADMDGHSCAVCLQWDTVAGYNLGLWPENVCDK